MRPRLRHQGRGQVDQQRHAGGAHHGAQDAAQQVGAAQAAEIGHPILANAANPGIFLMIFWWCFIDVHGFSHVFF